MFGLLFGVIFWATLASGQKSFKNLCYKSQVLEWFKNPSQFQWMNRTELFKSNFSSEQCFKICGDHLMPYSTLGLDGHCLCAYIEQENSIQAERPVEQKFCSKGHEDYVTVYISDVFSKISNVQIKASPESGMVNDNFTFVLMFNNVNKKVDLQFSIDFGDDNESSNWTSSTIFSHIYRAFSYYEVKIMSREVTKPQDIFILASKTIQVAENISYSDAILSCASLIAPLQDPECNVTIFVGQNMKGTVNFGDNTTLTTFKIPGKLTNLATYTVE